jgi:hypothetical protein
MSTVDPLVLEVRDATRRDRQIPGEAIWLERFELVEPGSRLRAVCLGIAVGFAWGMLLTWWL